MPLEIVAYGLCHCGCGRPTSVATETRRSQGIIAGKPKRYLKGHPQRQPAACPVTPAMKKRATDRALYEVRGAEVRARAKEWQQANPERAAANSRRNKLRRRYGMNSDSTQYAQVLALDPCSYCGDPAGEVDHISPVALGGDSQWQNLTAACRSCNASKNAKPLLTYLVGRAA